MKIMYLGNFREPGFEGLMSISKKLQAYFGKKHTIYVNEMDKLDTCDIVHIHSSGYSQAIAYADVNKPKIFSHYTHIECDPFKILHDSFGFYAKLFSRKEPGKLMSYGLKSHLMTFFSYLTPIWMKRNFFKKMDLVVLPNQLSANILNLKNVVVIRQGVDVKRFRKQKKKGNKKIRIRYFGHPSIGKGILEVNEGFSRLDSKVFDKAIYLTFTTSAIKRFIHAKDKSIKIGGYVKNIVAEYNDADIILLPYRHSGASIANPLTLIEAMACEKAVITTELPHLQEICGDAVAYVKPYSVKQIVKTINLLKDNLDLRERLGKKARERIIKFYNEETMLKEYGQLYNNISASL